MAALITLAIVIIFSGFFYDQYHDNQSFSALPYGWRASWITSPYQDSSTACFRKTFFVRNNIRNAYLVLGADNFYDLRINGKAPGPLFRLETWRTLPKLQTPYVQLGYRRNALVGHLFMIAPYLQRGENVITVMVQSDQGKPRMAAQMEVMTADHQELLSDSTWKCAPHEDQHEGIDWTSPDYESGNWRNAVMQSGQVNIPVDGDPSIAESPMSVRFIGSSGGELTTARFRRIITCPDVAERGYIRVASPAPYDLFLNGVLIHTTSLMGQYNKPLIGRSGSGSTVNSLYDTAERIQFDSPVTEYPVGSDVAKVDQVVFRNLFHAGSNMLEVVLHNEASLEKHLPVMSLDAQLNFASAPGQRIISDSSWETTGTGQTDWTAARIVSIPLSAYRGIWRSYIHAKRNPDMGTTDAQTGQAHTRQIIWNDLLLLFGYLAVTITVIWGIQRLHVNRTKDFPVQPRGTPALVATLCVAPAAVLIAGALSQVIWTPSVQKDLVSSPEYAWWVLCIAALAYLCGVATLAAVTFQKSRYRPGEDLALSGVERALLNPRSVFILRQGGESPTNRVVAYFQKHQISPYRIGVIILTLMAGFLYLFHLGYNDYLPDEYTSLMAARGIVRHGIPLYEASGIIYSRSVIYHYLLALCMIIGHSTTNAYITRLPAAIWGIALVPLSYLFGRAVQSRTAGLLAAAFVALSPFTIFFAREARFYSQFEFFATLFLYLLYRSVQNPEAAKYRTWTMLAFIGAYLSQEFAVTLVPAAVLVILLSHQTPLWLKWRTFRWVILAAFCILGEFYLYSKYCATPLMSVDTDTMLLMAFHTDMLDVLPSMLLVGNERSHLVLGVLYGLGLIAVCLRPFFPQKQIPSGREEQPAPFNWGNYLYLVSGITIIVTALLTPRPANRYIIHMFPVVCVTAACVAVWLTDLLRDRAGRITNSYRVERGVQVLALICVAALCLAVYRPLRIWDTLTENRLLNRGTTLAGRYVQDHRRPGDKLIFFSPDIGTIESDECDYFWRSVPNSIFLYRAKDGKLRERDTGAVAIDNVDKLRQVVIKNDRVWLILPRKNVLMSGAQANGRLAQFVNDNFQVQQETLGIEVLVWDRSQNHYKEDGPELGYAQYNF